MGIDSATPTVDDRVTAAGSSNAAVLRIEQACTLEFDVYWNVGVDGKIQIEFSDSDENDAANLTSSDWKAFDTADTSTSDWAQEDYYQNTITQRWVRVYADGNDFTDSDVTELILSTRHTQTP